ncbi:MAG TPA: hypothetical protein VKT82_30740 [Ktedonobacterales bacterium]|nr:hypothetical protein [Ktedonobacterales bacterium]
MMSEPLPTLLVISPDPTLVSTHLALLDHVKVVLAVSYERGIACYERLHPTCVLIDATLPGGRGYPLLQALWGSSASATPPLLLLTTLEDTTYPLIVQTLGTEQCLALPLPVERMVQTIQALLILIEEARRHMQGEPPPDEQMLGLCC